MKSLYFAKCLDDTEICKVGRAIAFLLLALLVSLPCGSVQAEEGAVAEEDLPFAVVNGEVISAQEYQQTYISKARSTFFHGAPPEKLLNRFRVEMGQELIDGALLRQEAKRRGVEPDHEWVQKRLDYFEGKYARRSENGVLTEESKRALKEKAEEYRTESRVRVLEEQLRDVAPPTAAQLQAYYEENPDKFTSPEQIRLFTILKRVEPWAGEEVWEARREEMKKVLEDIKNGADFAELAELHSEDATTGEGGDMGYLHRGMLSEPVQLVVDDLAQGDVSDIIIVLEGVVIVRLEDRRPAVLNPLTKVKVRAEQLWIRREKENAYEKTIAELRANADLVVNDKTYLALLEQGESAWAEEEGRSPMPITPHGVSVGSGNVD